MTWYGHPEDGLGEGHSMTPAEESQYRLKRSLSHCNTQAVQGMPPPRLHQEKAVQQQALQVVVRQKGSAVERGDAGAAGAEQAGAAGAEQAPGAQQRQQPVEVAASDVSLLWIRGGCLRRKRALRV